MSLSRRVFDAWAKTKGGVVLAELEEHESGERLAGTIEEHMDVASVLVIVRNAGTVRVRS